MTKTAAGLIAVGLACWPCGKAWAVDEKKVELTPPGSVVAPPAAPPVKPPPFDPFREDPALQSPKEPDAAADKKDWSSWKGFMEWLWPKSLDSGSSGRRFKNWTLKEPRPRQRAIPLLASLMPQPAPKPEIASQQILGWYPGEKTGQRQLYHQKMADGTEREVFESEMGEVRELSRQRATRTDPNNPLRKVTGFEVTYEDGTKKFIQQDPLVFDLSGLGIKTTSRKILYGLAGTSKKDVLFRINDVGDEEGILVFDPDRDGVSGETGLELFGDQSDVDGDGRSDDFPQGFDALKALVARAVKEGVLRSDLQTSGKLETDDLKALEASYGLKMKVGGFNRKAVTLAEAGVSAIALSSAPVEWGREFDGRGNSISFQPGAVFLRSDGSAGAYANLWFSSR
ncbi:MAG: hypothetical protein WC943_06335 [Elusimicrobiota bacterium]